MILAAGLLVLVGLGLFLAGVLTGTTAFYWACVAVCAPAFGLLLAARRRITRAEAALLATQGAAASTPTAPPSAAATATPRAVPPEESPSAPASGGTTSSTTADGTMPSGASAASVSAGDPSDGDPAAGAEALAADPAPTGAHAARSRPSSVEVTPEAIADPPIEDVEVTDLLLVVDLEDEVLVVDEHPRYHLAGCRFLAGRTAVPLPMDEARVDGFTPCALCAPDRNLADRERARKRARG